MKKMLNYNLSSTFFHCLMQRDPIKYHTTFIKSCITYYLILMSLSFKGKLSLNWLFRTLFSLSSFIICHINLYF